MMAYLAELDTRLLLYIQDALRYEPLHSFWRGISFLGDLGWFWIFTGILLALIPNAHRRHNSHCRTCVKHVYQQRYFKKRRYASAPV